MLLKEMRSHGINLINDLSKRFPTPGIETEPPGCKPGTLATRPYKRS